jgi:hypothetical protein
MHELEGRGGKRGANVLVPDLAQEAAEGAEKAARSLFPPLSPVRWLERWAAFFRRQLGLDRLAAQRDLPGA